MASIKPSSIEQLVEQYYKDVQLPEANQEELDKLINAALTRYESGFPASNSHVLQPDLDDLNDINKHLKSYCTCKNLFAIQRFVKTLTAQQLIVRVAELLEDGYAIIDNHERRHLFNFDNAKKWAMVKPEAMQKEDKQKITDEITALYQRKVELEREALLSTDKAVAFAQEEHEKQQAAHTASLHEKAQKAATAAAKKAKEGK